MFLIDNSGSMVGMTSGQEGRDRWGSRYTVVRDLLDTIFKVFPGAEVGVAVFRDYLYFNPNNNDYYFSQLFEPMPQTYDNNPNQGYLPLLQLNRTYGKGANAKTGIEIIKDVLATETRQGETDQYVDLVYNPGYATQGYTNINIGFLAVQEAFKKAVNPTQCQYVIFFSDGEANDGNGRFNADRDKRWFTEGRDMPTTFTVYFTGGSLTSAHPDLYTMTDNIKANGYSSRNVESELWAIQTSHETLLALLTERVLGVIFNTELDILTGKPAAMTINSTAAQSQTDTSFIFAQRFGLEPGTTKFTMSIRYQFTRQNTGEKFDSTLTFDFYVKRQAGAQLSQGVVKNCWMQPTLDLLYNGASVAGSVVNETMTDLQIRLDPNGEDLQSAYVTVKSKIDNEGFPLIQSGGAWVTDFQRLIATAGSADDKKLQHLISGDSIIVVWRNPAIPLDTVRIAVPFKVTRTLEMGAAFYYDRNADGYIDSIYVSVSGGTLSAADVNELKNWATLPPGRGFFNARYQAEAGGFSILADENKGNPPNTGIGSGDVIKITGGQLTNGGLVVDAEVTVQDKMAPVIVSATLEIGDSVGADRLVIEFSEPVTPITFAEPFNFKARDGAVYHVSLQALASEGVKYTFRVVSVSGVDRQNAGDSLWINVDGNVLDLKGNKQDNPANRRVALNPVSYTHLTLPTIYSV